jgi:hypothetical protein
MENFIVPTGIVETLCMRNTRFEVKILKIVFSLFLNKLQCLLHLYFSLLSSHSELLFERPDVSLAV